MLWWQRKSEGIQPPHLRLECFCRGVKEQKKATKKKREKEKTRERGIRGKQKGGWEWKELKKAQRERH